MVEHFSSSTKTEEKTGQWLWVHTSKTRWLYLLIKLQYKLFCPSCHLLIIMFITSMMNMSLFFRLDCIVLTSSLFFYATLTDSNTWSPLLSLQILLNPILYFFPYSCWLLAALIHSKPPIQFYIITPVHLFPSSLYLTILYATFFITSLSAIFITFSSSPFQSWSSSLLYPLVCSLCLHYCISVPPIHPALLFHASLYFFFLIYISLYKWRRFNAVCGSVYTYKIILSKDVSIYYSTNQNLVYQMLLSVPSCLFHSPGWNWLYLILFTALN